MVAHHEHLKRGGIALKSYDTHRLPLCLECHDIRHHQGVVTFWGEGVDLAMMCLDYITAYFIELAEGVEYEEKEFVELVSMDDYSDPGSRRDLAARGSN